jgi:UDP-N-acetylglucosamine acyltransferase
LEEEMAASDERDEIVTFVRESNRGIIKRFTKGATDDDLSV